jgi:DNA-binding response OmpR family regulator
MRPNATSAAAASRRPRVLVVEDEALLAMMVEDTLAEAGCAVLGPTATVADALALLGAEEAPSAAVLDLNLAGETSAPVAAALAARGVPFVVATGYGASGLPDWTGGAPVVAKPFGSGELVAALARLGLPAGRRRPFRARLRAAARRAP